MNTDNSSFDYNEKDRKKKKLIIAAAIAVIIIIIILLITSCGRVKGGGKETDTFDLTTDVNSRAGGLPTPDIEAIREMLNSQVADGMINISMNMNPVFSSGTAEGNLLIVNEKINRYPQVIEIYLKDSDKLIYRSGGIEVGSCIEKATLLVDLEAGSYDATAYFNAVDPETGEVIGKAGAEILITVLS